MPYRLDHQTVLRISGNNRWTTISAFLPTAFPVENETTADLRPRVRMTLVTATLQEWFDRLAKELRFISASCREAN